jgi:hypothetical protein
MVSLVGVGSDTSLHGLAAAQPVAPVAAWRELWSGTGTRLLLDTDLGPGSPLADPLAVDAFDQFFATLDEASAEPDVLRL